MKSSQIARIRFLALVVLAITALFDIRLFYLQLVRGGHYNDLADRQYLRPSGKAFDRGAIFFSTKDGSLVSAATLKHGFTLAINPELVVDKDKTYEAISALLPLDRDDFMTKAGKADDPYEELVVRIDQGIGEKIRGLALPGVILVKEKWRYYPGERTAAHVIGLMGYKGDDYTGRYGLELYHNDILSRDDKQSFANFFAEIFLGINRKLGGKELDSEGDIVLTIEPRVQTYLENELASVKEKYQAQAAGGIIMDPKTGEIFAMGALPNFNPGERQASIEYLKNPLVENIYELGSIFKPLTMAAGLDSGAVTANTTYDDKGFVIVGKAKINNYDFKSRGIVPVQEILNQSLNTGSVFIAQKIGRTAFAKYMKAYGLGEKTGIDLPGEREGMISNLDSKQEVDVATVSFGQGIAVSPIEMIRALASLGNGGYLVTPHVVKTFKYTSKLSENVASKPGPQVLKKTTSEEITRMLVTVVDKALLGGTVKMPHTTIAAKTGTAQISEGKVGYEESNYLHSFFGYFPAYNPRFIVLLYVVKPQGVRYASETLTLPFMDITKFLLNYYEVPPDR